MLPCNGKVLSTAEDGFPSSCPLDTSQWGMASPGTLFTIARLNGFVDDKGNVGAQQIADAYEAYVAALKGIK